MRLKGILLIGCMWLLSGCNALDGKCDYIPKNDCGCGPCSVLIGSDCKRYLASPDRHQENQCGPDVCTGGTCAQSWACGKPAQFNDR